MFEQSQRLFQRAQQFIPGGVNSPVRAFRQVGGTPVFFQKGKGALLTDVDGNTYIDYVGSWGPLLTGHADPKVLAAIAEAAALGTSFGAPTEREVRMAELLNRLVPGLEKVRMVNSGTEATMTAIRVARGYTGRNKIIKFRGCYHGHGDSFLIKAGSGALTLGTPDSPGVTPGTAQDTLLASFNDLETVRQQFSVYGNEIAAVIVEPVAGNMACIPPQPGFLEGLRELCTRHGAMLIFDEVMTGFRVAPGGAQQRYGVQADLVTLGKVIGAGLPVGAFGGKAEIMEALAPLGPVYQAGTLSGNPLAMAAGYALLSELEARPEIYNQLEALGQYLETGLRQVCEAASLPYRLNRVGSMISLHFTEQDVVSLESAMAQDVLRFRAFFHGLLRRGVYLPPSAFESWFISSAHTPELLDRTLEAARAALAEVLVAKG